MKRGQWLAGAVGLCLVAGPLAAQTGDVLVCAFEHEQDVKVFVDGGASAGVGMDAETKYHQRPALGVMGEWARAWDSVILELKPVPLAGEPATVSLAFKGATNLAGKIQATIQDAKGEILHTTLSGTLDNGDWQELKAALPGLDAVWEGGDNNRRLDPPCVLTALVISARRPAQATVYFADLKVSLYSPPAGR